MPGKPKRGKASKKAAGTVVARTPFQGVGPTSVPPVVMNPIYRLRIDCRAHPTVDTIYSKTYSDWMNFAGFQTSTLVPGDLAATPASNARFQNIRIRRIDVWGPTGGSLEVLRASSIAVPSRPVIFDEGAAASDRPFTQEHFTPENWASKITGSLVNDTVVPFRVSVHVASADEVKTQSNVIVHVHVDLW